MNDDLRNLLSRLKIGPAFLLLGQESAQWRDEEETEQVQPIPPMGSPIEEYESYADRIKLDPIPRRLIEISEFPWNGVYTTRVDGTTSRAFATSWRRVVSISSVEVGRNPRSSNELQIRHLFGGVSLPQDEHPPTDTIERLEARSRATESLSVLADRLLTPRGVIVIDGYAIGDWLSIEDLFVFLGRLGARQAYLFSASDDLAEDQLIQAAVKRGVLCLYPEPLATVLADARIAGLLDKSIEGHGRGGQRLIPIGDRFIELDVNTFNRVIATARPIDTVLMEPFGAASAFVKYERFRNMLGSSEGVSPYKAAASGYPFHRDFQNALQSRTLRALNELNSPDPIIVSGQTATGKSLALCSLSIEVARTGKAAVLHSSRRGERPSLTDVDAYAKWVEETADAPTLLIWDGMVDDGEYYTLQRQLRARGRRVLVVGSGYRNLTASPRNVVADIALSSGEVDRLRGWLTEFGIESSSLAGSQLDASFLAILYRLIPDSQYGIRRGLVREARTTEAAFERLAQESPDTATRLTVVAQALRDAGYDVRQLKPSERPNDELVDLAFSERSTAEQLTAAVLVAGQHGLAIPLELTLRVIGRSGWSSLVDLVSKFDLFRWDETERGDQVIGARTRLEAQLLAREDLTPETEIAVICELIANLRPEPSRWGGPEVDFIVELVRKVGPKSPDAGRYAKSYLDVAMAFKALRENLGRTHHRLVLQEANLTREYRPRGQKNVPEFFDRTALLRDTQRLLEETIEDADASGRAKLNLLVELASTIGAQVYERTSTKAEEGKSSSVSALMQDVIRAVLAARAIDPESYHPVDVVAWTTSRAIGNGDLTDPVRLELLANAVASLDSVDPSVLSPSDKADYDRRQVEIARLLDNRVLEDRHLESLRDNRDPAAFYFLARSMAQREPSGRREALGFLLEAPVEVRQDWRCARLLLDLFWEVKTGKRFLKGERVSLAFSREDWRECLTIADAVSSPSSFDQYRLQFLRGLALFHLAQYKRSEAVFAQLDRDSAELSSRVVSTYLASNETGQPLLLGGRVTWATPDGRRGKVWVEELGIEINFIPHRFSVSDFRQRGDLLPNFHIAFNMRGALADPVRFARRSNGGQ